MSQSVNNVIFREVQKFRRPLPWLFLVLCYLLVTCIFCYKIIQTLNQGKSLWDDSVIYSGFLYITITAVIIILYTTTLITEVRNDGIYIYDFFLSFPFARKTKIPLDNIKDFNVLTYTTFLKYGPLVFIRYRLKGDNAYTMGGNHGVEVELANSKRVLIGSQKPEELAQAIKLALKRKLSKDALDKV